MQESGPPSVPWRGRGERQWQHARTLVFEHGNAIGSQTDVYLYTGATLEIDAGVLQKCHDLYVDDVKMAQGRVYGSAGQNVNGADGNSLFAGGGGLYARGNGQGLTIILR